MALLIGCATGLAAFISLSGTTDSLRPSADAIRYLQYVVGLLRDGTFGLATSDAGQVTQPGHENAPLYMALIALLSAFDETSLAGFQCLISSNNTLCALPLFGVHVLNAALAAVTAAVSYLISMHLIEVRWLSVLTALLVVFLDPVREQLSVIAPENLMLPLLFAVVLAHLKFSCNGGAGWIILMGLAMGLLILTRPSFVYLFYGYMAWFGILFLWGRSRNRAIVVTAFGISTSVTIAPWILRNGFVLDEFVLNGGNYAGIIFAQRLAYNSLSVAEWGASLIYWLPGFGNDLAGILFGPRISTLLGWGPESLYGTAYDTILYPSLSAAKDMDKVFSFLIYEMSVSQWIWHAIVSISLGLRGAYVGGELSLIAIAASLYWLLSDLRSGGNKWSILLLPMLFMLAFHAAVSINIQRYNLFLILPYCIALLYTAHDVVHRYRNRPTANAH